MINEKLSPSTIWLNIDEAVKITGLSKSRIYLLTHKRKIPFYKYGKRILFDQDKLVAWIEGRFVKVAD